MTIRQTRAHGDLVDTLLQVVALDDVVGLVAYSIAISVALASGTGGASADTAEMVIRPIIANVGVLLLGSLFGLFLHFSMGRKHSTDNRLIISVRFFYILRNLLLSGSIAAAGLYVHGDGLYQCFGRRQAL